VIRGSDGGGEGEPPIDRTGAFGREPSCIGISRRTADSQNGTIAVSDQGAAMKKSDPRQLELFSDGARAVALCRTGIVPRLAPHPPRGFLF
jgi:hypothetical protein